MARITTLKCARIQLSAVHFLFILSAFYFALPADAVAQSVEIIYLNESPSQEISSELPAEINLIPNLPLNILATPPRKKPRYDDEDLFQRSRVGLQRDHATQEPWNNDDALFQIGEYLEQEIEAWGFFEDHTTLDINLPSHVHITNNYSVTDDVIWINGIGWHKVPSFSLSTLSDYRDFSSKFDTEDALHLKTGILHQYSDNINFSAGVSYDLHLSGGGSGLIPLTDRLALGVAATYQTDVDEIFEIGVQYQVATSGSLALPFDFGESKEEDQLIIGFSWISHF